MKSKPLSLSLSLIMVTAGVHDWKIHLCFKRMPLQQLPFPRCRQARAGLKVSANVVKGVYGQYRRRLWIRVYYIPKSHPWWWVVDEYLDIIKELLSVGSGTSVCVKDSAEWNFHMAFLMVQCRVTLWSISWILQPRSCTSTLAISASPSCKVFFK